MHCTECEHFDQLLFENNDLYLHFPLEHSCEKLQAYAERNSLFFERTSERGIRVSLEISAASRFLTDLAGFLSDEELSGTTVVACLPGEQLCADALGRVVTLERLVYANQARWVEQIITTGSFKSVFQPIYSGSDGTLVGIEALFRGIDENGTQISPGYLFELARRARMMFQTDLAARRSAVSLAAAAGLQDLKLFINFNPTSIYDPAYCLRSTASAITELGFDPGNIVFEVTETDKVLNLDHLRGILSFYRRSGFKIALDDIGAGYSGLNLLQELRPDYMKIDMELVRNVDHDPFRQSIVTHIVAIARENRIQIVAEGIETPAERAWVEAQGVDLLQGYLFSKPVDAGEIPALREAARLRRREAVLA